MLATDRMKESSRKDYAEAIVLSQLCGNSDKIYNYRLPTAQRQVL